jgi:ATP-dependent DNA helicase PIF1
MAAAASSDDYVHKVLGSPLKKKKNKRKAEVALSSPSKKVKQEGPVMSDEDKEIKWTPEQQRVIDEVKNPNGSCIFVSGPAGTGKSFLLKYLRDKVLKPGPDVLLTATTGAAAVLINGSTVHSALGLPVGHKASPASVAKKLKQKLSGVTDIYIDEISMLSNLDLDFIDQMLRLVHKKPNVYFGGVRLIAFGDFLQLPPVVTDEDKKEGKSWAFEAKAWKAFTTQVVLSKVQRQKDEQMIRVLQAMREGRVLPEAEVMFAKRVHARFEETEMDGIQATELFATNKDADNVNERELRKLNEESRFFVADEYSNPHEDQEEENAGTRRYNAWKRDHCVKELAMLKKHAPCKDRLELKVGAQVILIKNVDVKRGLCNGAQGQVIKWSKYEGFEEKEDAKEWPVVMFTNGVIEVIGPEVWKRVNRWNEIDASIAQVPLVLGWAMTIHKAQGRTMDRVKVNLAHCRNYGQVYVALSRTRTIDGLSLLPYGNSLQPLVKADPKAVAFYEQLKK